MRVGIPTEIKNNEYRVAITPGGVAELTRRGHDVLIQDGAGLGSAITNDDFTAAGARIVPSAADVWGAADLLLKVKEPIAAEYGLMRADQTVFTFLHLAASRPCTDALLAAGTTSIAYETVQLPDGSLPLLAPMSEVAGRLAPQAGSHHLLRSQGGRGVLMGGVPGTAPATVTVIGAGVSGVNAAQIAAGMGAEVTVFDIDVRKLRDVEARFGGRVHTRYSTSLALEEAVLDSDLVIGAVLIPGAAAPTLVTTELALRMRPGSVLVDIAIDQGGCFADSRPTTHAEPTFTVGDTVFYCVANMPGAVPRTSTYALTGATLPYVLRIANRGWRAACAHDPALAAGLSTHDGILFNAGVGAALGLPSQRPADALV